MEILTSNIHVELALINPKWPSCGEVWGGDAETEGAETGSDVTI